MGDALSFIERLHAVVDELAATVARAHGDRLRCTRGCSGCCGDDLTVFEIEADLIVARHGELLENGEPHPEGACAFLDASGGCRIYASRPYVCRTQGLPLRWLERDEDDRPVEVRDVCPLNEPGGPPLDELPADALWTIGPFEQRLAERSDGRRVALRDLFARSAPRDRRKLPVVR